MDFQTIVFLVPGFIAGLTVHEFSHAFVASRLGDQTAAQLGRLTLNPMKHLDLFGSLMLVIAGFGWAKPVPVNPSNLRNPRSDMLWISLAGPFSNLLIALTVGSILQFYYVDEMQLSTEAQSFVFVLLLQTVWINVILAVFNMIPLPPLDGSRLVEILIPRKWYVQYLVIRRIGPGLLLALFFVSSFINFPIFDRVLIPIARPVFNFCLGGWQI
jgi:Zn-dependent protease